MDRWANKVAVVTGAGSGIGAQFCRDLCANKVTVVGLDVNVDFLKTISSELSTNRFVPIKCDLRKADEIKAAFDRVISEFGGVDILVNCAGVAYPAMVLEDGGEEDIMDTMKVNLWAVIACAKRAYRSMADRDVQGHIVNICSISGHSAVHVPGMKPISVAGATKAGVKILNRYMLRELAHNQNKKVRVSNISPGYVTGTNIKNLRSNELPGALTKTQQTLSPKDVSDTLLFILSTPKHVQIREVIVDTVGASL